MNRNLRNAPSTQDANEANAVHVNNPTTYEEASRLGDIGESEFYIALKLLERLERGESFISLVTDSPHMKGMDLKIARKGSDRQKFERVDLDVLSSMSEYKDGEDVETEDGNTVTFMKLTSSTAKLYDIDVKTDNRCYLNKDGSTGGTGNVYIEDDFISGPCGYIVDVVRHDVPNTHLTMFLMTHEQITRCVSEKAIKHYPKCAGAREAGYTIPVRDIQKYAEACFKKITSEDGNEIEYVFTFKNRLPCGIKITCNEYKRLLAEWVENNKAVA